MNDRFKKIRKSGLDQNLKNVLQRMQYYAQIKHIGYVPNLTSGSFDNKNTISGKIWRNFYGVLYGEGQKKTIQDIDNLQNQLSMLVDGVDDKFTCELIIENIVEMNRALNILKISYCNYPKTISAIQTQIFNFEVIKNCIIEKIEQEDNKNKVSNNFKTDTSDILNNSIGNITDTSVSASVTCIQHMYPSISQEEIPCFISHSFDQTDVIRYSDSSIINIQKKEDYRNFNTENFHPNSCPTNRNNVLMESSSDSTNEEFDVNEFFSEKLNNNIIDLYEDEFISEKINF